MKLDFSIVISTYNREELLSGAIESLCQQTLAAECYEIIIVDNNSTDNTQQVVASFCKQYSNIRYYKERRLGLSYARNRGWLAARGKYVGFLDDDAKAPLQWLSTALEVVEKFAPGVFGGPYYPFYSTPRPAWFKDAYGSLQIGDEAHVLGPQENLSGGNFFVARPLLEALNGFDTELGMAGGRLGYGEETAFQRRVRSLYPKQNIYYEPDLFVLHLVPARKMTWSWIMRSRFVSGRSGYWVFRPAYSWLGWLARVIYRGVALLCDILYGLVLRSRSRYPRFQNYMYECGLRNLQAFGMLYEHLHSHLTRA